MGAKIKKKTPEVYVEYITALRVVVKSSSLWTTHWAAAKHQMSMQVAEFPYSCTTGLPSLYHIVGHVEMVSMGSTG